MLSTSFDLTGFPNPITRTLEERGQQHRDPQSGLCRYEMRKLKRLFDRIFPTKCWSTEI